MKNTDEPPHSNPGSFTANVGFGAIQENLNLKSEIDQFLENHEKWKKEYAQRQKLQELPIKVIKLEVPVEEPDESRNNKIKDELIELSRKCEGDIKEFALHKVEIEKLQQQKLTMDTKLTLSQKALENREAVEEMVSPLNELQGQLEFEADKLSGILSQPPNDNSIADTKESTLPEDKKVSKILADIDEDMKELDELLK
eukprot:TRINITY_DN25963_c0_g1_i2.p1 TRINITY_DN25963_c0_g1~~TRINITY_DN25963_c0_g1_i2.p1  ORF type:complete len:199 (-),score=50.72 TRINITY_DN25963_c0_g1_i2:155-751(-)